MSIAFEDRRGSEATEFYSAEAQVSPRNTFSPEVVDKLVDLLSTDDAFRQLFQEDARAALRQVGHETAADEIGLRGRDPVMCMVLSNGLASKAALCAGRDRIRHSLISTQVQAVFNISAN